MFLYPRGTFSMRPNFLHPLTWKKMCWRALPIFVCSLRFWFYNIRNVCGLRNYTPKVKAVIRDRYNSRSTYRKWWLCTFKTSKLLLPMIFTQGLTRQPSPWKMLLLVQKIKYFQCIHIFQTSNFINQYMKNLWIIVYKKVWRKILHAFTSVWLSTQHWMYRRPCSCC